MFRRMIFYNTGIKDLGDNCRLAKEDYKNILIKENKRCGFDFYGNPL